MVAGEVCRGFFQELELHFLFPGFPLELAQPRALIHGQRRLFAGMLTAVGCHPVTEGAFVDTELLRHPGNRTRGLDHHLHGFLLEFRREALLRPGQLLHLSRRPSYWMDCPEASGHPTRRRRARWVMRALSRAVRARQARILRMLAAISSSAVKMDWAAMPRTRRRAGWARASWAGSLA